MVLSLTNQTPFSCELLPMTEKNGASILRIVLKGTYQIGKDGKLEVAKEHPPAVMEDTYYGEPGKSAVKYESDIVLCKPRTDLLIIGQAHAPRGRPVTQMDIELHYQGRRLKQLRVFGDRVWEKSMIGWLPSAPKPFVQMPITYDRAWGGSDEKGSEERNRSGMGFASTHGKEFEGTPVPNIEDPRKLLSSPTDRPRPIGLGIIAKNWEPRLSFAGTYDEAWLEDGFPLLPDDFDMQFNMCTAPDQWVERPGGGEEIRLTGMTEDGELRFKLPAELHMKVALFYKDRTEEKGMDLDTLLVEPDERRLTLTWRGSADIQGDPFRLEELVVGTSPERKPSGCERC
jgi:hypothetical protein